MSINYESPPPEGKALMLRNELVKSKKYRLLGEALIEAAVIDKERLTIALDEQRITAESVGEILVRLGLVSQENLNSVLAKVQGVKQWNRYELPVDESIIAQYDRDLLMKYKVLPLKKEGNTLTVATPNVSEIAVKYEIERIAGCKVELLYDDGHEIENILLKYGNQELQGTMRVMKGALESLHGRPVATENDTRVVELINSIFEEAVLKDASDIHFEPEEKVLRIRERIDGILQHRMVLESALHLPTVARLKIMAGLDITETRLPQDGKFRFKGSKVSSVGNVDIRISTFLTQFGENVVCRLLKRDSFVLNLKRLGVNRKHMTLLGKSVVSPYGMILVSGPTGSGKTSTLYTLISSINATDKNIMTIEDPVEVELPMVRQSQLNPKAGITFDTGLRAILRQDPDIILIGEMRDSKTAEIAMRAALTGHLVFSTIHTNDAASAVARLYDLGVEPYLVASSLTLVIAQRLVRKICPACKEKALPDIRLMQYLDDHLNNDFDFFRGRGCEYCNDTGFKGRIAIMELLSIDSSIRELISRGANSEEIADQAKKNGAASLWDNALEKVAKGITTLEEAIKVTRLD